MQPFSERPSAEHDAPEREAAKGKTTVYRQARVAQIEDGASRKRGTVRVRFTQGGKTMQNFMAVKIEFLKTLRLAQREESSLAITTRDVGGVMYVEKIDVEQTAFDRVVEKIEASGLVSAAGSYAINGTRTVRVLRYVVRSTGVVLLVERSRAGGVDVYAPLSRDAEMDKLFAAIERELHGIRPEIAPAGPTSTMGQLGAPGRFEAGPDGTERFVAVDPAPVAVDAVMIGVDLAKAEDQQKTTTRCLCCGDVLGFGALGDPSIGDCEKPGCVEARARARRRMGIDATDRVVSDDEAKAHADALLDRLGNGG